MSTHLLLFWDHYNKRKGDNRIDMSGYEDDRDEWEEDPDDPSKDIKDRKKKKADPNEKLECSKTDEHKSV